MKHNALYILYFALFIALSSLSIVHAQVITFEKTFGGSGYDYGRSVQQTSDGGYIIAGYTYSFGTGGYSDVYLIKTDANGHTLLTKTFGGSDYDGGYSVEQTSDGGYIIAGSKSSFGTGRSDVYLIKTDVNGDTLFTKTFVGSNIDEGYSVQQTSDGGYIIAGTTNSFGAGDYDIYLIKTDANGDTLFTKTYGGSNWDYGRSVQQTSDGGYIIAGTTNSFGSGSEDVYLIKMDANGDTLFTKTFGGNNKGDYGQSVQQTSDGGYIIAGHTYSFGAGGADIYLIKTDANGDTLFTKTFGGSGYDGGNSVQQTSDGGYVIAGNTYSFGAGIVDVYLIKTDVNGDTLFTKTYGGSNYDRGNSVQQTSDGGYIIVGGTLSLGSGGIDVYLIKTDSNGNTGNNKYRTFKPSDGLGVKAVKLQYKKGKLLKVPNEATAVEAMFNIIERRSIPLLGIEQTNTDSVKKYSWVAAKNDKGKGASSIPKLFTSPHTGKAYPLDSLRKAGKKSKKIKGIITPDFKKYNNVAIEQGVLFNLNLYASNDGILPYGLGSLVFSKNVTVAGRLLQGKTLTEIGTLFDSMMTYYERLGINNESGYAELSLFVDSVLRPINEAFTANIDSTNYELTVPIDLLKKNPYAIRLLGVKTAEETGILQQVSKSVLPQIPFAETKNEPREFSLEQNYPNPFNPSTAISFQLSAISNVTLKIYNVLGQEVVTLIHSRLMEEGKHEVTFDASNLPSGMYFYRLTAGSYVSTKKLLLLK